MKAKTLVLGAVLTLGVLVPGLFAWATALPVAAKPTSSFFLRNFQHHADGPDRVFDLDVENVTNQSAYLRGRLVALSVYDTTQPTVIPIEDTLIAAHEIKHLEIRWVSAPLVGRMRALLVLSGGNGPSFVKSFDFWLISSDTVYWAAGIVLAAVATYLLLRWRRSRRKHRERAPANMVSYRVEFDDTVMTLSNRYGVTWQDLVKANHLKPPYDLKPGQRLLIPRHALVRPPETNKTI